MSNKFTASRISGDGNAIFPDEIILESDHLVYHKGKLIGCHEVKISYDAIGSVSINKYLVFADIVIETKGGHQTCAKGFTRHAANEIVNMINRMRARQNFMERS